MEKKPWDITKIQCFNCDELGQFAKDYGKVKHDWAKGRFITKTSVAKLGPNLILFRFKVGTNGVLCLLDSGTMHLFVSPNVVV